MALIKQNIVPCLWFDDKAEEAAGFYTSIFGNSGIMRINHYGKEGYEFHGKPEGSVMSIRFELEGLEFTAINGGPNCRFTPSISFYVTCMTESELNRLWEKLSLGGGTLMPLDKYEWSDRYGWLSDRYGLSWQISLGNPGDDGQKIIPCLLFTDDSAGLAARAVDKYTSLFDNSAVDGMLLYGPGELHPEGLVKHSRFMLNGFWFMAMESGLKHGFAFSEAVSFAVSCRNQEEVDHYWSKLAEGGDPVAQQCGWLRDQFGISWQIIPVVLFDFLSDPDTGKANRVTNAMLKMQKMDIELLRKAYNQN